MKEPMLQVFWGANGINQLRWSFWLMLFPRLGSPDDLWYYEAFNRAGNQFDISYGMPYRIDAAGEDQDHQKKVGHAKLMIRHYETNSRNIG